MVIILPGSVQEFYLIFCNFSLASPLPIVTLFRKLLLFSQLDWHPSVYAGLCLDMWRRHCFKYRLLRPLFLDWVWRSRTHTCFCVSFSSGFIMCTSHTWTRRFSTSRLWGGSPTPTAPATAGTSPSPTPADLCLFKHMCVHRSIYAVTGMHFDFTLTAPNLYRMVSLFLTFCLSDHCRVSVSLHVSQLSSLSYVSCL